MFFIVSATIEYRAHVADTRVRLLRGVDLIYEHAKKVFETEELAAGQVDEMLAPYTDQEIRQNENALHLRMLRIIARLPQVRDVWVIDRNGRPLVSADVYPLPPTLDLSDRRYFRAFSEGKIGANGIYVSSVLRGRAERSQIFFQVATARQAQHAADPGFSGVIAISVAPDYFQKFYSRVATTGLSALALIRNDGTVLAHYPALPDSAAKIPQGAGLMQAIERHPDRGLYRGKTFFDGIDRYVAYRRLEGDHAYVVISLDRSVVVGQWVRAMSRHLIFGLPATLLLIGLTLTAYRRAKREEATWVQFRAEVARREQAEAQLRQAQKLEAIGRLTGGIAHDFNNLMTVVSGSLELLQRRLKGLQPSETRLLSTALGGAERASRLTHRLLAFSRQQALDPRNIEADRLVGGMLDLLRRTLGELVSVETKLAPDLWAMRVDPSQLENALINLAVNARDAMPAGGRLLIETANVEFRSEEAAREDLAPGPYVMIAVSDTGTGMTPEVIANAFEPFFTTKATGAGTGLGLSQVFGFVKQSGGHVQIASQPGAGTSVRMYFPRAAEEPAQAPAPSRTVIEAPGEGVRVIVVEDEVDVRRFTIDALADLGFVALEAADGEDALRLLRQNADVRLLLTDVVMPGMDGRMLAHEVTRRFPDVSILFMTGYSRTALTGKETPAGAHVLAKPFTVARLAAKIREVLDEPNSSAAE